MVGDCAGHVGVSSGLFHTSSEVVPVELIWACRHIPAQSAFLEEVSNEKSLLVRHLTSGKAATLGVELMAY